MTGKNSAKTTYKEVLNLYAEGQNIFRRPSVSILMSRIAELELAAMSPNGHLTAQSLEIYAIDSKGEELKIEDLYWFEENYVRNWKGDALHDTYSFRFVVRLANQFFEFRLKNGEVEELEIAYSIRNVPFLFPICALAYHEELDDQGDRFCRMCGQALGVDQISDTANGYVNCPQDLSKWVNSDPKIIWFLYDIDLLPEIIKTKEQVCGLRGFQYGWTAHEKSAQQGSSSDDPRTQQFDR